MRWIEDARAGQPVDEIADRQLVARRANTLRAQPEDLRGEVTRVRDLPRHLEQARRRDDVVDGAAVLPDQRGVLRCTARIERNAAIELTRDRDGTDVARRAARCSECTT